MFLKVISVPVTFVAFAQIAACSGSSGSESIIDNVDTPTAVDGLLAEFQGLESPLNDGGSLDALQLDALKALEAYGSGLPSDPGAVFTVGSAHTVTQLLDIPESMLDANIDAGQLAQTGQLTSQGAQLIYAAYGHESLAAALRASQMLESLLLRTVIGTAPTPALDKVIVGSQAFVSLAQSPEALTDPQVVVVAFQSLASNLALLSVADLDLDDSNGVAELAGVNAVLEMIQGSFSDAAQSLELALGAQSPANLLQPSSNAINRLQPVLELLSGADLAAILGEQADVQSLTDAVSLASDQLAAANGAGGALAQAQDGLQQALSALGSSADLFTGLICGAFPAPPTCA